MTRPMASLRRRAILAAALAPLAGLAAGLPSAPLSAQEGAAAVQDVTLTDVVLPLGGTLLRAPKLTASGTRLSRDDLAAILKADSAEPWPARLARLDAGSLTMPVLVSEHAGPGDARQSVTYRDVVARDVRAGRVGELTAGGAALSAAGGSAKGSGTYGRIRATDLDLAALSRLYGVPGDGKGPVQRVYGTVQVSDVTYSDAAGTTVKIARLDGRELGGRQVPGGWNAAFDALVAGADGGKGQARSAGATADLIEAGALGAVEAQGFSVSDADPKGPLLVEIGRIAYAESGPDAGLRMEALSVARGAVRVRLGRLALSGVSLAPTVAGLRALAAKDPGAEIGEDDLRRLAPTLGALTLADLSVDLPPDAVPKEPPRGARPAPPRRSEPKPTNSKPGETTVGDALSRAFAPAPTPAPPSPPRVVLREATLGLGPARDGVPTSSRLSLSGLGLPASLVADLPMIGTLPAYGYRDLDLDLVVDSAWDERARDVVVREIALSGREIGSVKLSGVLGGIGPELFSGSAPAATMLMFSGSAKALDVTVENAGLFERVVVAQAKDMSLKPDELRKEYVTAAMLGVPVILGSGPAAKGIGAALGQFVMKPGRLVLRAKAKEPAGIGFIDLGAAASPAAVLDRLDVEAKAN
jgi:hypothetical protein